MRRHFLPIVKFQNQVYLDWVKMISERILGSADEVSEASCEGGKVCCSSNTQVES